jgi:hypothetical protein
MAPAKHQKPWPIREPGAIVLFTQDQVMAVSRSQDVDQQL